MIGETTDVSSWLRYLRHCSSVYCPCLMISETGHMTTGVRVGLDARRLQVAIPPGIMTTREGDHPVNLRVVAVLRSLQGSYDDPFMVTPSLPTEGDGCTTPTQACSATASTLARIAIPPDTGADTGGLSNRPVVA
jgi:hypothetical protein